MLADHHKTALCAIVGPKGWSDDPDVLRPHLEEWRSKYFGKTDLLLMPATPQEVTDIVRYAAEHSLALLPQGGNTGLVGGSTPGLNDMNEILLSTKRLNKNINVNSEDFSVLVDAGSTVEAIQKAAADAGLLFPLSLASEGSCTAGGVTSTNAGGVHVGRYGTTRALTLGLEAVLPDGSLYDGLSTLRKDNTGYDLNQLLIGAEGTLGIITKVAFKLFPAEVQRHTYWLAVPSAKAALSVLSSARKASGDRVSVFEILPDSGLSLVLTHIPGTVNPLGTTAPWYVLLEIATSTPDSGLSAQVEAWVGTCLENGTITDGAEAQSEAQRSAFWKLRESMSEAQKLEGASIKHDISVPVSSVPRFIAEATGVLEKKYPGCRVTPFGHLGDGNLHFNVLQPLDMEKEKFLDQWESMNQVVHNIVVSYKGSISAEHGIGTMKRAELARFKNPAALSTMRAIKKALDPKGIMNPGALFL